MNDEIIREQFGKWRVIASIGLSSNPDRMSHVVAAFLQRHGYRVISINPHETEVLGEKAYPNLASLPERPDLIQVFRRPDAAATILAEAARLFPGVMVWFQDGAADDKTEALAKASGVPAVLNDCLMRQHRRIFGGA